MSHLNQIALIDSNLEEVVFDSSPILNALINRVKALACRFINSSSTKTIMLSNERLDRIKTDTNIYALADLQKINYLSNMNFQELDLSGFTFKQVIFADSSFKAAILNNVKMQSCLLKGVDFSEAALVNADLTGSILTNSKFESTKFDYYTDLRMVDFSNAFINKISLLQAKTDGAISLDVELKN